MESWIDTLEPLDWESFEDASEAGKDVLARLAADRSLLRRLVFAAGDDRDQKTADGPDGGFIDVYDAEAKDFRLLMHVATGRPEALPHKHVKPFVMKVLSGQYLHSWFDDGHMEPRFVVGEAAPSAFGMAGGIVHSLSWSPEAVALVLCSSGEAQLEGADGPMEVGRITSLRARADTVGVL